MVTSRMSTNVLLLELGINFMVGLNIAFWGQKGIILSVDHFKGMTVGCSKDRNYIRNTVNNIDISPSARI